MNPEDRVIECSIQVNAPLQQVWEAWTTEAGAVTFFAPVARIEAVPDGPYEILFVPDAAPGQQGAEGMRILALQEPTFLSFTWNAPPHLPTVRGQRTHVELRFKALDSGLTQVNLRHGGWGTGGEWEAAFAYFSRAWPKTVLPRLAYRFAYGPVDWQHPPVLEIPSK